MMGARTYVRCRNALANIAAHKGPSDSRTRPPKHVRAAASARPEKCFYGNFSEIEGLKGPKRGVSFWRV